MKESDVAMKGMVFTEFLELVDDKFSYETCERLIGMSDLPSRGVYTAVGTYDHQEMVTLVTNLSTLVGVSVPDLLKVFGQYVFKRFLVSFPTFFEGVSSTMAFLPRVDNYVHLEVRKLYPDAELPSFECAMREPDTMIMTYRSTRNLPDLAEGLILGCIEHFGEALQVVRETGQGNPPETRFIITPTSD